MLRKTAIQNWERIFEKYYKNEILLKSYKFALNHSLTWPTAVKTNLSENGYTSLGKSTIEGSRVVQIDNRGLQGSANRQ